MNGRYLTLILLLFCACSSPHSPGSNTSAPATEPTWHMPAVGTIIAADSMEFEENPLNQYYFSVVLRVSTDNGQQGVYGDTYDILAGYGPAKAEGRMSMPRGADGLKPILKRDTAQDYGYIIGFIPGPAYGGDTSFKPYYQVSAKHGEIAIRQIQGYSFQ